MPLWPSKKKISSINKPVNTKKETNPYHCVELVMPFDACDAAQELHGKRFLSSEAPYVPLAKCDQANCSCRFKHHEDRRHMDRRDPFSGSGLHTTHSQSKNRRIRADRRGSYEVNAKIRYS